MIPPAISCHERLLRTARELGVELALRPDDAELVERLFFRSLVDGVEQRSLISHWGRRLIGFLLRHLTVEEHADVGRVIAAIDDNDGWPDCRILNAIKGLHCALEFRDANSRWLAEASIQVGELHVGSGPDGFRGNAKAWAGEQLRQAVARVPR